MLFLGEVVSQKLKNQMDWGKNENRSREKAKEAGKSKRRKNIFSEKGDVRCLNKSRFYSAA